MGYKDFMKILSVTTLAIPDVKVIRFARFCDARGYFTEPFRKSDLQAHPQTGFFRGLEFTQANESFSRPGVIRGLHFQWNPYMGKLVRTIAGRMVDLVLDIRKGSPCQGKIIAYDMPSRVDDDYGTWIWVPPGMAHGNLFTEPTQIEYYCTGEYSPGCEAGISPLSGELDWSLCDSRPEGPFPRSGRQGNPVGQGSQRTGALRLGRRSAQRKLRLRPVLSGGRPMIPQHRILFTGGSGLLGRAMQRLLPEARFPASAEFDVTDYPRMDAYVRGASFGLVVHAAAFTSPPKVEREPLRAMEVNIVGTANVVKLCMAHRLRLVYVSTDYVFRGDRGNYREDDPVHPVNKYAWSKLGGECAVRMYDDALIVRTSFGPDVFPYEKAFVDQFTSRESVSRFAAKLARLLEHEITGVIHVGGSRRTVFEYARSLDPARPLQGLSIREVSFLVPADTSLDCSRYESLGRDPE